MNPLAEIIHHQKVLVLDGALATELERAGADLHDPLWSAKVLLEQPELIKKVHADYFSAGADCVITASYQASFEGFAQRGLNQVQAAELMRLSVRLAIEARDEFWAQPGNRTNRMRPLIAASVGPYGAYLADGSEYRGNYGLNMTELMDFHRPRLSVLAETEADLIACESIPSFIEAQALTHLLSEFPQRLAWISFTAKDESHISEGPPLVECIQWLNDYPQIIAVGVNCTPPQFIPALVKAARSITDKAIVVYPNSGEGYSREDRTWLGGGGLGQYGQQAQDWYRCGANIIGGCCRTTPAEIRQVADWVRDPA